MGCGTSQYSKPGQITVNHFQISELISIGTFSSKVCIATRKSDKKLFAIKYISKAQSLTEKSLNCIISERKLLQDLKHPLINNIRYSFQNNTYLFIVTDYFPGGTLRFHLDNNSFQESMCVSIMAEICTALIYIHSKKIVHRDIKPENILLDSDGHAYITEFNVATIFAETKPIKSIAGTEPYMAPEVLSGNGYLYQVDFWSLGIMLFELIFKERPFRSKKRAELIKIGKYTVPESPSISIECRSLISELLRLNPSHRIGCSAEGINKLKSHHFFNTIRWNLVDQKLTSPVFIPSKTILNYKTTNDVPEILAFDDDKRNKLTSSLESLFKDFKYYDYTKNIQIEKHALNELDVNALQRDLVGHNRANNVFSSPNHSYHSVDKSLEILGDPFKENLECKRSHKSNHNRYSVSNIDSSIKNVQLSPTIEQKDVFKILLSQIVHTREPSFDAAENHPAFLNEISQVLSQNPYLVEEIMSHHKNYATKNQSGSDNENSQEDSKNQGAENKNIVNYRTSHSSFAQDHSHYAKNENRQTSRSTQPRQPSTTSHNRHSVEGSNKRIFSTDPMRSEPFDIDHSISLMDQLVKLQPTSSYHEHKRNAELLGEAIHRGLKESKSHNALVDHMEISKKSHKYDNRSQNFSSIISPVPINNLHQSNDNSLKNVRMSNGSNVNKGSNSNNNLLSPTKHLTSRVENDSRQTSSYTIDEIEESINSQTISKSHGSETEANREQGVIKSSTTMKDLTSTSIPNSAGGSLKSPLTSDWQVGRMSATEPNTPYPFSLNVFEFKDTNNANSNEKSNENSQATPQNTTASGNVATAINTDNTSTTETFPTSNTTKIETPALVPAPQSLEIPMAKPKNTVRKRSQTTVEGKRISPFQVDQVNDNLQQNQNLGANLSANLNLNSNANVNGNSNANLNGNSNANLNTQKPDATRRNSESIFVRRKSAKNLALGNTPTILTSFEQQPPSNNQELNIKQEEPSINNQDLNIKQEGIHTSPSGLSLQRSTLSNYSDQPNDSQANNTLSRSRTSSRIEEHLIDSPSNRNRVSDIPSRSPSSTFEKPPRRLEQLNSVKK